MLRNPIILKECLQASHRKRTYAFRALLVIAAIGAMVPQVTSILSGQGQDWRMVSGLSRAMFVGGSWTALLVFSLFAYVFSTASISEEWRRKTMEVLCASPLSWPGIVFGKLLGVYSKLAMLALALLPVLGVWYHMARVPQRMALGAVAIVFASTFFFASVALLQSVLFKPGRGYALNFVVLLLPYYTVIGMAYAGMHAGNPVLEAACSPRALFLVLADSPPASMSVASFVGLSLSIHVALGACALLFAPPSLARTFCKHIAGGESRLAGIVRRLTGKRPKIKPTENPFFWQEKGPPTAFLRWTVWAGLGIACLLLAARFLDCGEIGWLMNALQVFGMLAIYLGCTIYGANVFAREKLRGSAGLLILTGASPSKILKAKVLSAYWALRFVLVPIAVLSILGTCLYLMTVLVKSQGSAVDIPEGLVLRACLSTISNCILTPAAAVAIAMLFSIHARSGFRAFAARISITIVGTFLQLILAFWGGMRVPFIGYGMLRLLILGGGICCLLAIVRRWKLWHLCLLVLLATWMQAPLRRVLQAMLDFSYSGYPLFAILIGWSVQIFVSLLSIAFWFWLGTRLFESGMTEQPCPLYLRQTLRNGAHRIGRAVKRLPRNIKDEG